MKSIILSIISRISNKYYIYPTETQIIEIIICLIQSFK